MSTPVNPVLEKLLAVLTPEMDDRELTRALESALGELAIAERVCLDRQCQIRPRRYGVLVSADVYERFEPGDYIEPTSTRSSLEPGRHKVVSFSPPYHPGDQSVVFVEGQKYGICTEYIGLYEPGDASG